MTSQSQTLARLRYLRDVSIAIRMLKSIRQPIDSNPEPVCGHVLLNALCPASDNTQRWCCVMCGFEAPTSLAPTLLKFILNPGNISDLEQRLSHCTCEIGDNCSLSRLHGPLSRGDKYSFKSLIGVLFNVCINLVVGLKPGKTHIVARCDHNGKVSKHKGATFKIDWLRDTSALTPDGPRSAIQVLAKWVKALQISHPLSLFRNLVLHCPSLLLEMDELVEQSSTLLMSIRSTPLQPRDALQSALFKPTMEILLTADAVRISRTCLSDLSAKTLRELDHKYGLVLFNALTVANAKLDPVVRTHHRTAQLYGLFLDLMANLWVNRTLAGWGDAIELPLDPNLRTALSHGNESSVPGKRCWNNFGSFIIGLTLSNTCAHKPCSATADSIHKALRRCADCGVLRYCSRECQKASWNLEGDLCHKTVCATLGKLKGIQWESIAALSSREEVEAWEQQLYESVAKGDVMSAAKFMHAYMSASGSSLVPCCKLVEAML